MPRPKLAILRDYAEENWPSMELVAEMLARELRARHADEFDVTELQPTFKWRWARLPIIGRRGSVRMVDRLTNRLRDYPRWLAKRAGEFDLFHLSDHSYSQLVHVLPADRTGVFCHDLDTFRCLFDPLRDPRPKWFCMMAHNILTGMQKARVVFHSTQAVRKEILKHNLIDPARLVCAPCGVSDEFKPHPDVAPSPAVRDAMAHGPYLLHVGSCIARKRIDVLLDVFASLHAAHPDLRLIKVGGDFSALHSEQMRDSGVSAHITHLRDLSRMDLAHLYRGPRAVLITSDAEGFGLPLAEALACGAPVVASDIPVLREVGADAAIYCPVGDVPAWTQSLDQILRGTRPPPALEERLAIASRYSWSAQADTIAGVYKTLLH